MESVIRWGLLATALIVLPLWYLVIFCQTIADRPALLMELFVGFGTVGGWMLTFAFAPSPVCALGILFQLVVALPISLICIARVTFKPQSTPNFRLTVAFLRTSILLPLIALVVLSF